MQYRRQKIRKEDYRGLKLKEEVYLKLKLDVDKIYVFENTQLTDSRVVDFQYS